MKKLIPWLIIAALVAALVCDYAQGRIEKARISERLKAEQAKVDRLDVQIADVQALVRKGEEARAKDTAAAAEREKWFREKVMKPVETATPQQLVDDGARLLGAQDISTDGKSVTMGLDTWRRAVSILRNEEEYRLVREPRWLEDKAAMEGIIAGLKKEVDLHVQKEASLETMVVDLRKYIGIQKRLTLKEKVFWAAVGYSGGKGIEGLAKLF